MDEKTKNLARELEGGLPNWEYRVFAESCPEDGVSFSIKSVYFDGNGSPEFFSKTSSQPEGFSLEVLSEDLRMMKEALSKPVFDLERFPKLFEE